MAIIVSGGSSGGSVIKHTAPKGMHRAVLVDVIDLGLQQTQWGEKPKVILRWQIPVKAPDGSLHLVQKWYTKSLHEKAVLRHDLESWRGQEFTRDELRGFDIEKLLGVNCQLLIVHKKSSDGQTTWANVQAITPAPKGQTLKAQGYQRDTPDRSNDDVEDNTPDYGDVPESELPDEPPF
jgi:hypothetical protein